MSDRTEMQVGQMWAYRAKTNDPECPLVKAEVIQFGPKPWVKVRVRWHGGEYPGLDEWVPRVRLKVPWDDLEPWLRDERLLEEAIVASDRAKGTLSYETADTVISAYRPDALMLNWPRGNTFFISTPDAIAKDLGIGMEFLLSQPHAFVDRDGDYHAPASVAETVARLIAERFPDRILEVIQKEESERREWAVRGKYTDFAHIPAETCAAWLREREPVFGLVRQWCGQTATERFDEVVALRAENAHLRELVLDAAKRLKETGHPQVAARLRARCKKRLGRYRPCSFSSHMPNLVR